MFYHHDMNKYESTVILFLLKYTHELTIGVINWKSEEEVYRYSIRFVLCIYFECLCYVYKSCKIVICFSISICVPETTENH
jgi:hypothetical protein